MSVFHAAAAATKAVHFSVYFLSSCLALEPAAMLSCMVRVVAAKR